MGQDYPEDARDPCGLFIAKVMAGMFVLLVALVGAVAYVLA
jgi:hypothetical protein